MKILVATLTSVFGFLALTGRAQAVLYTFSDPLVGFQEVPPNPSTGLGAIFGTYDDVTNTFDFDLFFTGLLSPTIAAHLHSPAPPGVNAGVQIPFIAFPVGVTTGAYSNTYIFTAAQETDLLAGLMYVNIHTSASPGGEVRGQLDSCEATAVPEPAGTGVLLGLGIAGLFAFGRRWCLESSISAS